MSYIYLTEQGSNVSIDGGYCIVNSKSGNVTRIPIENIEYFSIFGSINITTPAMQMFMLNKIPVVLYSSKGSYFGRILSNENVNISRQRNQFELSGDTDFSLNISKKIISAKIHNQLIILNRYCPKFSDENKVKEYIKEIKILQKHVENCTSIEQIMGYEGIVARHYFKVVGAI